MSTGLVHTRTSPLKLVSNAQKDNIYHVQFVTNTRSKSGMSYPRSGANLLLVNDKREASLQYVARVGDAEESRFESGSVDAIDLVAPDWDHLEEIWVFPEEGTWDLSEVVVWIEGTQSPQRFPCNRRIGTDEDPAVVLHKQTDEMAFDRTKYDSSMCDYAMLKRDLIFNNTALVLAGTLYGYISTHDITFSKAFLEGGLVGILYMYLLGKQADYLGSFDKMALLPLVSGPVRLILISYITVSSNVLSNPHLLLPYTLGFFVYKLSVLIVGTMGKEATRH